MPILRENLRIDRKIFLPSSHSHCFLHPNPMNVQKLRLGDVSVTEQLRIVVDNTQAVR